MRLRVYYTRKGDLKFISHLNTIDLLQRTIFSTDYKVAFSEGFNPHPIMSFGNPLPLGVSSDFEVFDVEFVDKVEIENFINQANSYLPEEVKIFDAFEIPLNSSISKAFTHNLYEFRIFTDIKLDEIKIDTSDLLIKRKKKKKKREEIISEDVSKHVEILSGFNMISDNEYELIAKLENSTEKIINPLNFINGIFEKYNLDISIYDVNINKKEMISEL